MLGEVAAQAGHVNLALIELDQASRSKSRKGNSRCTPVGFQIAFNDRDPSSEVVHYVTWNGRNPTLGTNNFVDLAFDPPLLQRVAPGVSWNERLAAFLPWGVVGVLVLITILFFSRRAPLVAISARQGRVLRVLGVVLLVLGLLLPGFLQGSQTEADQPERGPKNTA